MEAALMEHKGERGEMEEDEASLNQ